MTSKNLLYIICVDDEKIILDSLHSQLTRNFGPDYNYEFAESAEEGLELIADIVSENKDVIYVVISDWLMPGMKGDEFLKNVRHKVDNVKTILLTGHVDNEVIRKIKDNEGDRIRCIFKPWDEKELLQLITAD